MLLQRILFCLLKPDKLKTPVLASFSVPFVKGAVFCFYNSDKTQNKEKLVKYFLKQADMASPPKQKDYSGVVENTGKMSDNLSPCRLNSIGVVQFYIELIKKIKSFARSFLKILSKGNCNTKTICLIHRTALVSQV